MRRLKMYNWAIRVATDAATLSFLLSSCITRFIRLFPTFIGRWTNLSLSEKRIVATAWVQSRKRCTSTCWILTPSTRSRSRPRKKSQKTGNRWICLHPRPTRLRLHRRPRLYHRYHTSTRSNRKPDKRQMDQVSCTYQAMIPLRRQLWQMTTFRSARCSQHAKFQSPPTNANHARHGKPFKPVSAHEHGRHERWQWRSWLSPDVHGTSDSTWTATVPANATADAR